MSKYEEGKMNQGSLSDFFPQYPSVKKSNAVTFATNKGEKEKCHCII